MAATHPTSDDSTDDFLGRVFRVLGTFEEHKAVLSLNEIAERAELPKTTVYRILGRLTELGAVDSVARGYALGMRLFEIGARVHPQRELREIALPFLDALCRATRQIVHFGIWTGTDVVLIEKLKPRGGVTLESRPGRVFPIHATAIGKAVLANLPREQRRQIVAQKTLVARTGRTITDPERLLDHLEEVRDTRLAVDDEEVVPMVRCVGAPVFGPDGSVLGGISVSGPIAEVTITASGPAVSATAMALTNSLRELDDYALIHPSVR